MPVVDLRIAPAEGGGVDDSYHDLLFPLANWVQPLLELACPGFSNLAVAPDWLEAQF